MNILSGLPVLSERAGKAAKDVLLPGFQRCIFEASGGAQVALPLPLPLSFSPEKRLVRHFYTRANESDRGRKSEREYVLYSECARAATCNVVHWQQACGATILACLLCWRLASYWQFVERIVEAVRALLAELSSTANSV